jgi:CPA2 family monovalent cation:H+ antiporter-2
MLGLKLVPGALAYFERVSPTSIVLLATSACFLIAWGFTLAGMPALLGAFLAGMIIASTKYGQDVKQWLEPISGLFTAIFFTAVGLLIDPAVFVTVWLPLLLLLAAAILGKALGGFLSLASFRTPLYPAAMFSMILVPRGEMTLVVAQLAILAGARDELLALGALLMFFTTLFAPLGVKVVSRQASFFEELWQRVKRQEKVEEPGAAGPLAAAPEGEKKG